MSNIHKYLVASIVGLISMFVFGGRAEAAKTFAGETHQPTSHREICGAGTPVDFSAFPSNISIDLNTGVMTYNINVEWASCNSTQTRAYAVYSAGQEVCPISGTYGASSSNGGIVTDCVKYVGSPAYQGIGNGLSCSAGWYGLPGVNEQCVNLDFAGVRRSENRPSNSNTAVIPMQYVIPNWSSIGDTGSWTIGNAMCQYYKSGSNFSVHTNNRCINVSMTVSWTKTVVYPSITCGSASTNPTDLEESQGFTLSTGFTLNDGEGQAGNTTYSVSISLPAAGVNSQLAANGLSIPWSGGSGAGTIANLSIADPGVYPVTYTVTVTGATNSPQTCNGSIRVVKRPYLSVYGGDVKVGGAFVGGDCSAAAGIRTYYRPGIAGSGVQFAAVALGTVRGFNSARLRTSAPTPDKGLTFANLGSLSGQYGAQNCLPDYFADASQLTPQSASSINIGDLTEGSHLFRTGGTISIGGQVTGNRRINLYIEGNVRITDSITFASDTWTDFDQIPALHLYVKGGDILIEPDVTELTGTYTAQPSGGVGGTIITCVNVGTNTPVPTNQLVATCSNQLKVTGSFVSQKTKFLRVANSLRNAGSNESNAGDSLGAEVFNLSPDQYITAPQAPRGSELYEVKYQSFTGLPPIL